MIRISLKGNKLCVKVDSSSYGSFNNAIRVLKDNKFRYNSTTKEWLGPWFKRDDIKGYLEDYDTVEDTVTQDQIDSVTEGKPEQFNESIRRIPDYSLMNFPPIEGKHPYENFQKQGISRGINSSRFYYAWDCGSGKSYVASALIAHRLLKYKDCSKVVLVTSSIGVRNLYHELFKFIKDLDESKVEIADKNNRDPFDHKDKDIIITSYNSWRLICDFYKKKKKNSNH